MLKAKDVAYGELGELCNVYCERCALGWIKFAQRERKRGNLKSSGTISCGEFVKENKVPYDDGVNPNSSNEYHSPIPNWNDDIASPKTVARALNKYFRKRGFELTQSCREDKVIVRYV